ncbi:MAG: hypothetical protein HY821_08495 [Acidobacteria bacterium]|nr:hypothetical protein [Acidobacteriota bacterium]
MKWRLPIFTLALAAGWAQNVIPTGVNATSHNLSANGTGPVKSTDTRSCVFCHISHNGYSVTGYLWTQKTSTAPYTAYSSPTMQAAPADPGAGPSKLCLSCHDGTIAVGATVALGNVPMSGSMSAAAITGQDFGRHHPVRIRPVNDGQLNVGLFQTPPVSGDPAVRLRQGLIECVTCHEPHAENRDSARQRFLVRSNQSGAICLACHDPSRPAPSQINGWTGSAHQAATNTTAGTYYGAVNSNACYSCHLPHSPVVSKPLMRAVEESSCVPCHAGSGTSPTLLSVMSTFNKAYAHPTTTISGSHAPGENAFPLNISRHAECPDCHNSHASQRPGAVVSAPVVQPALIGATGVDAATGATAKRPAANEYEICFKCHANSSNKPQAGAGYSAYGRTARRVTDTTSTDPFNKRLEFNSSVARHNVTFPRQRTGTQVPSLRAAMLTIGGGTGRSLAAGTYIYCGDCHNNDQARNSGGAEASGAHGSAWPHLLERRYDLEPPPATAGGSTAGVAYTAGISGSAALCYKCHDLDSSILQDRSFKEHNKHISGERTSCSTCHDAHGIDGGNATNNFSMVNFDRTIVGPSSSGILRFERTGTFAGRCYLTCHGQNHNPISY